MVRVRVRTYSMDWIWVIIRLRLCRVPIRVSHVAIGESSKELAEPNLWILAILAKSININFS